MPDEKPVNKKETPLSEEQNAAKGIDDTGISLSYTINLNLPETSDITVFNAIFKSLKENLLNK